MASVDAITLIVSLALSLPLALVLVNVVFFAVGFKELSKAGGEPVGLDLANPDPPSFSIIVPTRNEAKVIKRCLDSILSLEYPRSLLEVVVVDSGSTDGTLEICMEYSKRSQGLIKLVAQEEARGKPSALNLGLRHVKNDVVLVLDADSVLDKWLLMRAAKYFKDPAVVAVQGRNLPINEDVNLISKLTSIENKWFQAAFKGRELAGLFTPFLGSCTFVRRRILEELGGWSERHLSEDMELSARLLMNGYSVVFVNDLASLQEYPSSVKSYLTQRYRWLRGSIEVALSYLGLLRRPSAKRVDALLVFMTPVFMALFLLALLGWVPVFLGPSVFYMPPPLTTLMTLVGGAATLTAALSCRRPLRLKDLLIAPLINLFWVSQSFIALKAIIDVALRRPQVWVKTEKTGSVA